MHIAAYINGRVAPQRIAERFIKELLQRSNDEGQLCMDLVLDFIRSNLSLIGFPCDINRKQALTGEFEWPTQLRIYTFAYNSIQFAPFAKFLTQLPTAMEVYQRAFDQHHSDGDGIDEVLERPLNYLLELLAVWHNVCTSLQQQEDSFSSRHFEEPIARINFYLLLSMHRIRKNYRLDFHHLDTTCARLYSTAVKGIFYPECHLELVEGLSQMFAHDFYVFYQHSATSLSFFVEVFSVKGQKQTYIKIFKLLCEMLQNPEWTQNQLLILTDFLIDESMQEVYYSFLKLQSTKQLLLACLGFLDVLQSKIPTADCFSKAFVEVFWTVILNKDAEVSSEAAEVYITIMRRKFDDCLILKHILEGYFTKMSSPASLPQYIQSLWSTFPAIQRVNEYLEIISSPRTANPFRAYVAHFLVEVYRQLIKKLSKYAERIEQLLIQLPSVLEELKCKNTIGILLKIYGITDFQNLSRYLPNHMEVYLSLEKFALGVFFGETDEYPLLTNLFIQFSRCMRFTKNWSKLELHTIAIYEQLREIEYKLNGKRVQPGTMQKYNAVLQKLALILKPSYNILDYLPELVVSIEQRLIVEPDIYEFAKKTKSFLDVYAIRILTSCLGNLVTSNEYNERTQLFITTHTQKLHHHLLNRLKNIEVLLKMPLVRIETTYNSFIELHCIFHRKSKVYQIKLNVQTYHILVETLILCNFVRKTFNTEGSEAMHFHPLRTLEYQQSMFREFIRLHTNEDVEIPSNVAWKLCIFYGLPGHKFNAQLAELLKIIANKHLKMYKHILPVLVFNLYKRQPPLNERTILQALRAHNDLISSQIGIENPHLLKVHIVLTVLQIVEKSVRVIRLNSFVNRLVALRHLNSLVAGLQWSDKIVQEMILKQAAEIRKNLLTEDEIKDLQKFTEYFEKHF